MQQFNKNGIPVVISKRPRSLRRFESRFINSSDLDNDFNKYRKFATLSGFEDGCKVIAIVPLKQPEFQTMLEQGYKVIEVWDKKIHLQRAGV